MNNFLKSFLSVISAIMLTFLIAVFFVNAAGVPHLFVPVCAALFLLSLIPLNLPRGSLFFAINAKDILFGQGKFNPGGTADYISYAFVEDILTWPAAFDAMETTDTATTFAELVTIPLADPFVFKTGKCFFKLYCTQEEGEVKTSMIGVTDSMGWQNEGEGSFPDNDEDFLGFLAAGANRKMVAIYHEANGRDRVIGFPKYPARFSKVDSTSGKKVDDGRRTTYAFIAKGGVPAPIYKAPVSYTPAV